MFFFKKRGDSLRILGLFDGISCGQYALNELSLNIKDYYSSEIDKNAMCITHSNFPKTHFIGDVTKIDNYKLSEIGHIDIIFAGFPCQNISSTGDRTGLAGSKSSLFFHFYRILEFYKKINKNILFLVENVGGINQFDLNLINELLGVDSVILNSANYSPQRRIRHYWTNIPLNVGDCQSNNDVLGDVIDVENDASMFILPEKLLKVYSMLDDGQYWKHLPFDNQERIHIDEARSRYPNPGGQTSFWKLSDKMAKSQTLMASGMKQKMTRFVLRDYDGLIRYPTPIEFERLQGLPDNYTSSVSDNKRYYGIGNGWSINTVKKILGGL